MRTLTIRVHIAGTHPVEYREVELSATRKGDVRKAITRSQQAFGMGNYRHAELCARWAADALAWRIERGL